MLLDGLSVGGSFIDGAFEDWHTSDKLMEMNQTFRVNVHHNLERDSETKALTDVQYAANPSYTFHRLTPKATEVTTVAGISGNITTVANNDSNITTVAGNNANVTTVAGSITNVNNVGGSIANVNTCATNLSLIHI